MTYPYAPRERGPLPGIILAAVLITFATSTELANGAIAVSNLANFYNGNFGITQDSTSAQGRAQAFTTGSEAFQLVSVSLTMSGIGASGSGGFHVSLYSDANGSPGTVLLPLNGSDSPLSSGDYTYTASSPFELAPNTTYWLAAELPLNSQAAAYYWTFTANTAEIGLPGWSLANTSGISSSFFGQPYTWGSAGLPLRMSLDVQSVPEPGIASVLTCAAVGVLSLQRCRPRSLSASDVQ